MNLPRNRFFLFGCVLTVILLAAIARFLIVHQNATQLDTASSSVLNDAEAGFSTNIFKEALPTTSSNLVKETFNPYEITVVTLYINIGKFQKGNGELYFTPETYKNWMKTWGMMTNKVIGFFDSNETMAYFRSIRSSQPSNKTVLIQINRTELPAFNDLEKIRTIYQLPGYPRHPPNTVVPEYSCAMSAKYDAVLMALDRGLVLTKYVAWVDIGMFRLLLNDNMRPKDGTFTLEVPDDFDPKMVSDSEVTPRAQVTTLSPRDYIYTNTVWVAGGYFVATPEVVKRFIRSYKKTVEKLLARNLSSTDQQVIGSMFSPEYIKDAEVQLKPYRCKDGQYGLYGSDNLYFCFGYICKEAAENRRRNVSSIS